MKKNSVCKTGNSGMESSQKPFKRRALLMGGGVFASMLLVHPTNLLAQAERSDGPRRINLSGRQRMLIQRAGKFVCLAYQNPDPAPLLAAAAETLALHQTTEAGLKDGDDELGLEPETNASVLSALTRANNAFAPYGQTIRDAIEGRRVEQEHLQAISDLNGPALADMDAAVNLIERVYKSAELSEQMAMLINISGRQRMFTQRLVLLLCLSRSGLASSDTREELFRTMNRFNISLNILNRVTPGALRDSKSRPIIERLNSLQGDWAALRERISTTLRITEDGSVEDILHVNERAEELLNRMNAIVLLYEEAAE
ncbi:type IV pili methyl-accepting chemotaxis transducer N-terminal domain-containing protein [Aliisedimentitalea scapharcae]|uniref:Type IV pili methyl-accepting chemotaxis transducer N-terminal domain-containing protein n=1 Tax=Aliisedimentitalea scapharcae TaxID=1524259 RepID=A0ABZ2XSD5_9RHOB